MSNEKPSKQKISIFKWIILILIPIIFFLDTQLPGGVTGLVRDYITESSADPKIQVLRDKMLKALVPLGAAAMCMEIFGENAELKGAALNYNERNKAEMERLTAEIADAGGMSDSEIALINRKGYREAQQFVGKGSESIEICSNLTVRINSGEFDLAPPY